MDERSRDRVDPEQDPFVVGSEGLSFFRDVRNWPVWVNGVILLALDGGGILPRFVGDWWLVPFVIGAPPLALLGVIAVLIGWRRMERPARTASLVLIGLWIPGLVWAGIVIYLFNVMPMG